MRSDEKKARKRAPGQVAGTFDHRSEWKVKKVTEVS